MSASYKRITWEELKELIPNSQGMTIRPDCGLLLNGNAFAVGSKTKDHYLLFPNKRLYVSHFAHFQVSMQRLTRDEYTEDLYVQNGGVKVDHILGTQRLATLGITEKELCEALSGSTTCFVTYSPTAGWIVKRTDNLIETRVNNRLAMKKS